MKKWLLLLLIVGLVLLMTACGIAQVTYRLDDDFSVGIDYRVALDSDEEDASQYTNAIIQYWNEMGFATSFDDADGLLTIVGTKKSSFDTPKAAADAFSEILKDENSIFQDVSFTYIPSFEYDRYNLSASVSLQDIIRQSDVQNIPQGEIDTLEGDAANGTYTLCLVLPGEVVSTNAESQQDDLCTWTLRYDEVTSISLETQKTNSENIAQYEALQEQQRQDEQMLLICGGGLAVIVFALIVVTVVRNRKNRPLKVRVKKF